MAVFVVVVLVMAVLDVDHYIVGCEYSSSSSNSSSSSSLIVGAGKASIPTS